MPDLDNLPQAIGEGAGYNPIQPDDTAFEGESLTDENALKLVIQDTSVAETFVQSKTIAPEWNACDDMYRDYVVADNWPNTDKPRSSLPIPVIMEAVESLLPQAHMAFFSAPQPFLLDPVGKTTAQAAKAMAHLAMWGMEQAGFQEEIRKVLKSGLLYGTLIAKEGWATTTHKENNYSLVTGGSTKNTQKQREVSHPTFEYVSLRNFLPAPDTNCQDIQTARFATHQKFIDSIELDDLSREDSGYKNVPTRAQLREALTSEQTKDTLQGMKYETFRENKAETPKNIASADPLKRKLELLEYWTKDRVITVLQRTIVIRNEANPFGRLPFRSCCFIDVLDSFYGFGIAKLLAGEQNFQQAVLNAWVDNLSLQLSPAFIREGGMDVKTQDTTVHPGKVISSSGKIAPLQITSISQEAMGAIEASSARAARRVGNNSGSNLTTGQTRTAEGVQAVTADVQIKLQYFIETFAKLVFVPAIEGIIQTTKDNLEPDEIKAILSDRDVTALEGIDVLDIYNGKFSVNVLSSVKLTGRRGMAQMITPITQLLGQPTFLQILSQQGKKFDFAAFMDQVFQITGWPGDELILDMTPEDMQRMQQSNPALVNAQAKQAQSTQDHINDVDLIEKKGDQQAGVSVVKSLLKPHEEAATAHALALASPGEDGVAK